jgi:Zn-dependent M28 family amino/carboxypeptidase
MRKAITTLAAALFSLSGFAQDDQAKFASSITQEDLKKHLSILASDAYEGRETGQKGQKMAAEYISNHFKALGLTAPVNGSFYQPFDLVSKKRGDLYLKAGSTKMEVYKHFMPIGGGFEVPKTKVEAVFVGLGIDAHNYSDYQNLDVKDKYVVFVDGEPKNADGKWLVSDGEKSKFPTGEKMKIAKNKGAKGIILVAQDGKYFERMMAMSKEFGSMSQISLVKDKGEANNFGAFVTNIKFGAQLLGTDSATFHNKIAEITKTGKTTAGAFRKKIQVRADLKVEGLKSENVLGFMEGTDKKDEVLVITSHYDHVGIIGGKIHNGADDDGSGTVSVLEIAEAFVQAKAAGKGPRRSILFMTVSGEEKGLLGSEFYTDNPVFPLANTVANLNIDMVGRIDDIYKTDPNYIYLIGADKLSTELHNLSEAAAKKYSPDLKLDYKYNDENDPNRFYYRSDHYNFAKHNIPIIFYFNGTHEDYHKYTDDVEKIHFPKMEKIARLIFHTAWDIANRDNRLTVDKAQK